METEDFSDAWAPESGAEPAKPEADDSRDDSRDTLADVDPTSTTVEVPKSRRQQIAEDRAAQAARIAELETKTAKLDEFERRFADQERRFTEQLQASRRTATRAAEPEKEDDDASLDAGTALKVKDIENRKWQALKDNDHEKYAELGQKQMAIISAAQAKRFAPAAQPARNGAMEMIQAEFSDVYRYADENGIDRDDLVAHLRHFDAELRRTEKLQGPALWRRTHEKVAESLGVRKTAAHAPSAAERAAHTGAPAPRNGSSNGNGASNGGGNGKISVDLAAAGLGTLADVRKIADKAYKHLPPEKRVARYLQHYARSHPEHTK